jgi:protein-S-isoprenylcysteine O-methyltransferase Ste14
MKRKKSLEPPTFLLIYLLLALTLHFFFPIKDIISGLYRFLGVLIIAFGVVINLWADSLFKKEKTTVKPDELPSKLITKGPFRFSRHPMYLGFVLLLLGVAIILGSLSSFISPVLMFLTLEWKFIPLEEKQMEKSFEEKYLEYKNRVRRWL